MDVFESAKMIRQARRAALQSETKRARWFLRVKRIQRV